jgi:hypothetical protein
VRPRSAGTLQEDDVVRAFRFILFLVPLLALLGATVLPRDASTLPLFARKYSMPCTQCHMAFPRLNAFGVQFRQNGYRLEGDKGASPWEDNQFPLSLIGNVGVDYARTNTDAGGGTRVTTTTSEFVQNQVEFHSAGTLAPGLTFHFDNGFAGPGGVLESGMAFVQFDDLSSRGRLNLKAGIYDAEIPYISDSRRTTWEGYLTPATLDGRGIELNGTNAGWTYALGLINSERTHGKASSTTLNQLENPYVWLMRDIKGQLVTARVFLDMQDPRKVSLDASQHLVAQGSAFINSGSGRWAIIPGYTFEHFADADSALTAMPDRIETALLEGIVKADKDGRWVLTGRYELRHQSKLVTGAWTFPEEDDQLLTANVAYYYNPNARIVLDWAHTGDNIQGPRVDSVKLFAHVGY